MRAAKTWILRLVGLLFLAGAMLQWVSYNAPAPAGASPAPHTMAFGWLWTALIALPGIWLLRISMKE